MAYWKRMENCSSNPLLNATFKEMNNNNHEWTQNIKYLLDKLGMGNLWEHKNGVRAKGVKGAVASRMNDMYIQKQNTYTIQKNMAEGQTEIVNICRGNDEYRRQEYPTLVNNLEIRNHITRLRIDCNNSNDCKARNVRFKDAESTICSRCNVKEDVRHLILHCNKPETERVRKQ